MEPATFTPAARSTFSYGGQSYDLPAGQRFEIPFTDPCDVLGFVNAAHQASGIDHLTNETPQAYQQLQAACQNQRGASSTADGQTPPPVPPPQQVPADGQHDQPPISGEESAESLDAPRTPPESNVVEQRSRTPGTDDGRSLAQQHHDPRSPMPDYEVAAQLASRGQDVDGGVEAARHNDPPDDQVHPDFGQGERTDTETVADPVSVFDGAFCLSVTDVEIASVGMPLRLTRRYRSGKVMFGPWGYNWDHNYDVRLRELSGGQVAVWTGGFSEEVHRPDPSGGYEPPIGVFRQLTKVQASPLQPERFELAEPHGLVNVFERPPGWPRPEVVPLRYVEDRHGNRHELHYDAEGRLEQVTDAWQRFIAFEYGDCGLVEHVRDHTGRRWDYWHDEAAEHLAAVVQPATPDQPDGPRTRYEYDEANPHPARQHDLVRIFDAEGRLAVENQYSSDPETDDFGRVVEQEYGGFEASYRATELQVVPHVAATLNVPARQVEVIDPGVLHVFTFNWHGDILDERFRLAADGSYRLVVTTFRYDEQANQVERTDSDGHGLRYVYDDQNPDPRARGNVLTVVEHASPLAPAPDRVVLQATYEPRYQLPRTLRDATGAETRWVFDYEGGPPGSGHGDVVEIRRPDATLPDGTTQRTTEQLTYTATGQLATHVTAEATFGFSYDGAGYLTHRTYDAASSSTSESFEHDAVGNLTARTDGVGNRTSYDVNALCQVAAVHAPDGATWEFHRDACGNLARAVEPRGDAVDSSPGTTVEHTFEFDVLGHLVRETRGANSGVPRTVTYRRSAEGGLLSAVDPLGRTTTQTFDERGLLLGETVHDADGTLARARRLVYERGGQCRSVAVEGGAGAVRMSYNGFGELERVSAPDGSTLRLGRDVRGLLTEAALTDAAGRLHARRRFVLDERGRQRRLSEALFIDPAHPIADVHTDIWFDHLDRPAQIAYPTGLRTSRAYSALGVLVSESDSLGNSVAWTLDAAGRPVEQRLVEQPTAGAPRTFRSQTTYDVRGRPASETDPLGNVTRLVHDLRGRPVRMTNALGEDLLQAFDVHDQLLTTSAGGATMRFERDAAGRVERVVDPTDAATALRYDALDRLLETRRADGRTQVRHYDATSSLREYVDFDGSRLSITNNPVGLPVEIVSTAAGDAVAAPTVQLEYDAMRRVVRATSGAVTHRCTWDSLGRLVEEAGPDVVRHDYSVDGREHVVHYPDGRADRVELDALTRPVRVSLVNDGSLDLARSGLAVGTTLASIAWSGVATPGSTSIASDAVRCRYLRDGANRQGGVVYQVPTGTVLYADALVRNAGGRTAAARVAAPAVAGRSITHDRLGRVTEDRRGTPGAGLPADPASATQAQLNAAAATAAAAAFSTATRVDYDPGGLPSRSRRVTASGATTASHTFTSDALHQLATIDGSAVAYDAAGNLRDGLGRTHVYDTFRRLVEVRTGTRVAARFSYDGLGRMHTALLGSGPPTRFAYNGNEVLQESRQGRAEAQYVAGPLLDQPLLVSLRGRAHRIPLHDATGSTVAVCDHRGAVLGRYAYDVHGTPAGLTPNGSGPQALPVGGLPPRFLGRPWLDEPALYDFRARFYSPSAASFLQPDPHAFADSWCPYAFVGYDPYDRQDPFGAWLTILAGAVIGAAIGGIGAAISGGSGTDILVGIGAGAVGGAIAGAGNPALGAAVAGGLAGAWSGGRIGYRSNGVEGAVVGSLVGAVAGAGLGAAGGALGSKIGNVVATRAAAGIYSGLIARGVLAPTATAVSRYGGMVAGGYAGGAGAAIVTNSVTSVGVDLATGGEITPGQFGDAIVHGVTIDGPLNAVGAVSSRLLFIRGLPGNRSNQLGAEGEQLVGAEFDLEPANGRQRVTINGRERRPDFDTSETIPEHEAVFEVKNKASLSSRDLAQLRDFATLANNNGAELLVFERPGAGLSSQLTGVSNARFLPIPQRPLVVTVPGVQAADDHAK